MVKYSCALCKVNYGFQDIRYSSDGKRVICKDCYNKLTKKTIVEIKNDLPIIKIICKKCRYKFSLHKGSRVSLMCPYCGGYELMKDESNAQKLLEEVSRESEIY